MAENLTKKEKGFIKDYVETGNGTKSALNNYDTNDENVAAVIASENLRKPKIQEAIKSIAESIPDEDLIRVHKEGLEASRKTFKNNNKTGEIEEVADEPDYAVRHKYLDSAYKLKGVYAPEKKELSGKIETVDDEKLKKMAQLLENQLKEEDAK